MALSNIPESVDVNDPRAPWNAPASTEPDMFQIINAALEQRYGHVQRVDEGLGTVVIEFNARDADTLAYITGELSEALANN